MHRIEHRQRVHEVWHVLRGESRAHGGLGDVTDGLDPVVRAQQQEWHLGPVGARCGAPDRFRAHVAARMTHRELEQRRPCTEAGDRPHIGRPHLPPACRLSVRPRIQLAERAIEQAQIPNVHDAKQRLDRLTNGLRDLASTIERQRDGARDRECFARVHDLLKQRRDRFCARALAREPVQLVDQLDRRCGKGPNSAHLHY